MVTSKLESFLLIFVEVRVRSTHIIGIHVDVVGIRTMGMGTTTLKAAFHR
jgi:hypothetical protein